MEKGDQIEVYLHDMSHDGRAVGRLENGMTVFIYGGIIGQTVRAEIISHKKRMAEADILDVLEKSPYEVTPACIHAYVCGGCPWMGIAYDKQTQLKEELVRNSLVRIGHLQDFEQNSENDDTSNFFDILSSLDRDPENKTPIEYRNKMEFAFALTDEGQSIIGLRKRYSHEIVEVTDCLLQKPIAMKILDAVRDYIHQYSLPFLRYLLIRIPSSGTVTVECITHPIKAQKDDLFKRDIENLAACVLALDEVNGFTHSIRHARSDVAYGDYIVKTWGNGDLHETVNLWGHKKQYDFSLGSNAFFQVNTPMAEILYAVVYAFAKRVLAPTNNHIWDVYCGIGSIGICLADLCKHNDDSEKNSFLDERYQKLSVTPLAQSDKPPFLFGIENVSSAIRYAKQNFKNCFDGELHSEFICDDATKLPKFLGTYGVPDLIVLDPPRAGLDTKTLQSLLKYKPSWCILVSCHPSALARDVSLLAEQYDLRAVQTVDLFPHSPHVESVALLQKKVK